jgi:hypothetical protein
MADAHRLAVWRDWLRARFGPRLDEPTLDTAARACERLRETWQLLLAGPLDDAPLAPTPLAAAPPDLPAAPPDLPDGPPDPPDGPERP